MLLSFKANWELQARSGRSCR